MKTIRQNPAHRDSAINRDHSVRDSAEDRGLEDSQEEETHGDLGERNDGFVEEGEGVEVLVGRQLALTSVERERERL